MKIYTSEVEMLRAQCREWEKVCDSHLRLIKKLKKERRWIGLTPDEMPTLTAGLGPITLMPRRETEAFIRVIEAKLKEKNT